MAGVVEFLKSLGGARIVAMAAVTVALVTFFGFLITRITAPQMAMLFSDLSQEDSSAIIKDLERQAIPFELRNDGSTIMVPRERITRLRMRLAEGGLPKGGGVGYEIFDRSDALGATSFVQNVNHLRALEGELARTIRALDRVQQARVHLVLPERQLFARERAEATASIALRVRGTLESQQVRAIRHLVASAVPGLKPERVSIVDDSGRLLADGARGDDNTGLTADERRTAFERRLREQVESIVTSVVGSGRARVQLSADFDFNRVTETSERFDPEGRVMRSSQTREESSASASAQDGQVSVGNELPGGQRPNEGTQTPREQSRKSEEVVNYEISKSTKTEVTEGGRVNRISVAVLVDGVYTRSANGDAAYQPRPQQELDRIAALVRTAIGFDQRRGDQVEVVNLRFADLPAQPLPEAGGWESLLQFTKADVMHWIELLVMVLLGLVVLFTVVRPLLRRALAPDAPAAQQQQAAIAAALASGDVQGAIAAGASADDIQGVPNNTAKMMDIAQVQGQVHAQSVQRVGELVQKNPNEAVAIIRTWLHEQAA